MPSPPRPVAPRPGPGRPGPRVTAPAQVRYSQIYPEGTVGFDGRKSSANVQARTPAMHSTQYNNVYFTIKREINEYVFTGEGPDDKWRTLPADFRIISSLLRSLRL
ncbi:hypothetical protein RR46_06778 [Papilio xuthus]|uniref:Uncharacterized protein n=1 Tax=Papilio xuthus TaxID=66420 RepID=A0A194PTF6_PAPXU|nr:hypothetical protein RR46_06778 [Papilio xuthus]